MFDLKVINTVNSVAAALERRCSDEPAYEVLSSVGFVSPETKARRAFSRRVALLARDANIGKLEAAFVLLQRETKVA